MERGRISSSTRLAGVIGRPIRHSLSPVIHNAAFDALGIDCASFAFEVAETGVGSALAAVSALGMLGLSVTMPCKDTAARAVERLSAEAARLGAVNCIGVDDAALVGHNTDGVGLVESLRSDEGFDPSGARCVVLGAGGAARAAVLALGESGAAEVVVVARNPQRADLAASLSPTGRAGAAGDVAGADLVLNATPVGMGALSEESPIPGELLGPAQLVVDLIYSPTETVLLEEARRRGARAVNGIGMLVHQAAHQIHIWTGSTAPVAQMRAAAERELAGS